MTKLSQIICFSLVLILLNLVIVSGSLVSERVSSMVIKEPNVTITIIVQTNTNVTSEMMQVLYNIHKAMASQIGSNTIQVQVIAKEIPEISEYNWVKQIKLPGEDVETSKMDNLLKEKIEESPNEVIEIMIFTFEKPNKKTITELKTLGAFDVRIPEIVGENIIPKKIEGIKEYLIENKTITNKSITEAEFLIAKIEAQKVKVLLEQPWVKRVVLNIELKAHGTPTEAITISTPAEIFGNNGTLKIATAAVGIMALIIVVFIIRKRIK